MSTGKTNVHDLLATLRERRRRLPFEIGAFLALQVTEELLERPRNATAKTIFVLEDGSLDLTRAEPADERDALRSLHDVLVGLLAAAGEGVPPMLLALVERPADAADVSLARWRDELEASLIPLNRSAAKRVLARTLRDLGRDAGSTKSVSRGDPDAALDALLEGREAPEADQAHVIPGPDSLPRRERASRDAAPKRSIFSDADGGHVAGLDEDDGASGSWGARVAVGAIVLAAIGAAAYAFRPAASSRSNDASSSDASPANRALRVPDIARGEIAVEVEPEGAIVRIFLGRAPTLADDIPVGVAQELVAISDDAEGLRSIVPSTAAFRSVDGLPELTIRIEGTAGPDARLLGSTELRSETMGRPSGRAGRIRIDTSMRAAKIYRTVGFAPLARVDSWPVDRTAELLVSARGFATQRIVIAPSDFRNDRGESRATVHVALVAEAAPTPLP